jgi:hypothetical protein
MLDFDRVWLPQILGFASLVADERVEADWIRGDTSRTRVASLQELYEQVFEDLDSAAVAAELHRHLPGRVDRQEALASFLRAITHAHLQVEANPRLRDPRRLFATRSWLHLRGAAEALRQAFRERS